MLVLLAALAPVLCLLVCLLWRALRTITRPLQRCALALEEANARTPSLRRCAEALEQAEARERRREARWLKGQARITVCPPRSGRTAKRRSARSKG